MKNLSRFEWAVLALTAAFVLFSAGYFTARRSPAPAWRVETQRNDTPDVSAAEDTDRPDSLLEGERINLNTASAADLERLPGIGPSKAQTIVEDRQKNGPFATVDQLKRVNGIGEGILEQLRPYVVVG